MAEPSVDEMRDLSLHRRVSRGAASNYVGQAVVVATWFFLAPFVLDQVGASGFGLWILVGSLASYGGILELGISSAVEKYVAEYRARDALEDASSLVKSALVLQIGLGLVALAVAAVLAPFVPDLFGLSGDQRPTAVWLTLLVGLQLAVAIPAAAFSAVLRGVQRFELANVLIVGGALLSAAAAVVALLLGGGVVGLVASGVATTVVMQLPGFLLVRRAAPELRLNVASSRRHVRAVVSFSWSVLAIRVAELLTTRTDPLVIRTALPVRAIAPYTLAQRLGEAVVLLVNQFLQVLLPVASELDTRADRSGLRSLYVTAARLSLAISIPIAATLAVLASSILEIWVGPEYAAYSDLVLILAISAVVDAVAWPSATVLTGMARHRPLAWMALGNGVANVGLSAALVHPLGLTGVAIGTLVPTALEAVFLVLPYSFRTLDLHPARFIREAIAPNLVPTGAIVAVLVVSSTIFDTTQIGVFALVVASAAAVYLAAYLRFGASATERAFYRKLGAAMLAPLSTGNRRAAPGSERTDRAATQGEKTKRGVRH